MPHCGSKTINVRLTVSPEGKSKAAAAGSKLKKNGIGIVEEQGTAMKSSLAHNSMVGHSRRQHRYRPRKLIKSDDEDDDSTSDKDVVLSAATKSKSQSSKFNNKLKLTGNESGTGIATASHDTTNTGSNCCQRLLSTENSTSPRVENISESNCNNVSSNHHTHDQQYLNQHPHQHDNIYENMANLKCCSNGRDGKTTCDIAPAASNDDCRVCSSGGGGSSNQVATSSSQHKATELYMKHTSSRVKMMRKARKQKVKLIFDFVDFFRKHHLRRQNTNKEVDNSNFIKTFIT